MESANRKLIRPSFNEFKEKATSRPVNRRHRPEAPGSAGPDQRGKFLYVKQMQSKTPMVITLKDGEVLKGVIEWYDRSCLKVNRDGAPEHVCSTRAISSTCTRTRNRSGNRRRSLSRTSTQARRGLSARAGPAKIIFRPARTNESRHRPRNHQLRARLDRSGRGRRHQFSSHSHFRYSAAGRAGPHRAAPHAAFLPAAGRRSAGRHVRARAGRNCSHPTRPQREILAFESGRGSHREDSAVGCG